jgi:raffinose/stachyose/melibiose transport system substrate-binding protein
VVREQKAMAVQAGPVAELTEQIHPALLTLGRSGDELYALPLEASFAVFWYDRGVFEPLGLEPPRTWEELLAACDRLREAGLVPIALGNRGRWPVLLYYGYLVDRLGVRGLLDEAVRGTSAEGIRDARFARAWQRLRELAQAGAFPEGAAEMTDVEAIKMFFEGRAGMYLGTTTTGYRCQRAAPELLSRLDCFPFPVMAGAEEPTTPTFLGTSRLNMVIWPNTPTVDHAGAVLRRFASRDVAEALARGGRVPTLKDSLDTELLPEPTRRAVTLLDAPGTRLEPYLDVHLVTSVSDTLLEEGAAVLAGRTTPEDAAAAVAEQVEELAKSRRHSPGQQ